MYLESWSRWRRTASITNASGVTCTALGFTSNSKEAKRRARSMESGSWNLSLPNSTPGMLLRLPPLDDLEAAVAVDFEESGSEWSGIRNTNEDEVKICRRER